MSQENVEIVRRRYPEGLDLVAALADRQNFDATLAPLVQPDFEIVSVPGQVPLSGVDVEDSSRPAFHGVDGFARSFGEWLTAWESWVITGADLIDVDESRVLVLLDIMARSKTHQVEMPLEGANLLTLREGRLARMELFFDRSQALEAAGLRE